MTDDHPVRSIDAGTAAEALADIDRVTARVRQSRIYTLASSALMLWGPLVAVGYVVTQFAPRWAALIWPICHVVGLASTVWLAVRAKRAAGRPYERRLLVGLVIIVGFGLVWSMVLGRFGPREMSAFWATLFMCAYILAGLWLGRAFVVIGTAIATLTIAGYAWAGGWFDLYMAVVNGGGLLLCGLWMRRG